MLGFEIKWEMHEAGCENLARAISRVSWPPHHSLPRTMAEQMEVSVPVRPPHLAPRVTFKTTVLAMQA